MRGLATPLGLLLLVALVPPTQADDASIPVHAESRSCTVGDLEWSLPLCGISLDGVVSVREAECTPTHCFVRANATAVGGSPLAARVAYSVLTIEVPYPKSAELVCQDSESPLLLEVRCSGLSWIKVPVRPGLCYRTRVVGLFESWSHGFETSATTAKVVDVCRDEAGAPSLVPR